MLGNAECLVLLSELKHKSVCSSLPRQAENVSYRHKNCAKSSPIGAFNVMCRETLEFLCSVVGYTCRIQLQ